MLRDIKRRIKEREVTHAWLARQLQISLPMLRKLLDPSRDYINIKLLQKLLNLLQLRLIMEVEDIH